MESEADPDFKYVGTELDLFSQALNWKTYWSGLVRPYCRGVVWEVGAGLGANTPHLINPAASRWICMEPDGAMVEHMRRTFSTRTVQPAIEVQRGTVRETPAAARADTILYIDVLEHIEDDREELASAAAHLHPGGALIVLAPAHDFLFSPFDKAIGHFRRYNRASLRAIVPPGLTLERLLYLDSVGMLASLANRIMLRQASPTLDQILLWDRRIVPLSAVLDRWLGHHLGKSILGVYRA